jgi:hypothetical protein
MYNYTTNKLVDALIKNGVIIQYDLEVPGVLQ